MSRWHKKLAARDLGLQPINDGDVKRTLLEHLRGRELLLVLDNFEYFVDQARALLKNADGAAGSHFLAAVRVARVRFINKQGRFEEALAIVQEIAGNEAYPQEMRASASRDTSAQFVSPRSARRALRLVSAAPAPG